MSPSSPTFNSSAPNTSQQPNPPQHNLNYAHISLPLKPSIRRTYSENPSAASIRTTTTNSSSSNRPLSPSKFYFDDDSSDEDHPMNNSIASPIVFDRVGPKKLLNALPTYNSSSVSSSSSNLFRSSNEILNFPTESTNAYSYAHLSPNSLALRLNVLKRSLEILIDRPELITSLNSFSEDALTNSGLSPPHTPINNTIALFNPKSRTDQSQLQSRKSSGQKLRTSSQSNSKSNNTSNNQDDQPNTHRTVNAFKDSPPHSQKNEGQIKIETNASSAALAAFFRTSNQVKRLASKRSTSLQTPFLMNNNRISNNDMTYLNQIVNSINGSSSSSLASTSNPLIADQEKKEKENEELAVYEAIRDKLRSMIRMLDDPNFNLSTHTSFANPPIAFLSSPSPSHLPSSTSLSDLVLRQQFAGDSDEIALNLHNLSLSNVNDESKEKMLQRKLLYALATPFYESISTNNIVNLNRDISSAALNQFNNSNPHLPLDRSTRQGLGLADKRNGNDRTAERGNNGAAFTDHRAPLKKFNSFDDSVIKSSQTTSRPFHLLSTSKNMTPQAIFTCEIDQPWNLRAANDLSTLIFGLKNQSINIKDLKLMDLIADNSRDFVEKKLIKRLGLVQSPGLNNNNNANHYNKDILFAGEIVAIQHQTNNQIHWCSLWGKRKNDLIILMFDKIPCIAVDLTITNEKDSGSWNIDSFNEVTGRLLTGSGFFKDNLANGNTTANLAQISKSINRKLLKNSEATLEQKLAEINETRYFTLNIKNRNLPCAVLAEPEEQEQYQYDPKQAMTLKVHTLPYIAGIFIISASSYNILSYNRSILKNLFGYGDLINQSINKVIPNFTKFIEFASSTKKLANFLQDVVTKLTPERFRENPGKYLLPGLVLPEHFFRKIQAKFQAHRIIEARRNTKYDLTDAFSGKSEEEIEEELFLSSKGIYGKHSDGSSLTVDVQLRVSSIDTLVLWVTYTNSIYGPQTVGEIPKRSSSAKKVKFTNGEEPLADQSEKDSIASSLSRESSIRTKKSSNNSNTSELNDFEIELNSKASSSSLASSAKYLQSSSHSNPVSLRRSNSLLSDLSDATTATTSGSKTPIRKRRASITEDDVDTRHPHANSHSHSPINSNSDFETGTEVSTPPTTANINDIKSIDSYLHGAHKQEPQQEQDQGQQHSASASASAFASSSLQQQLQQKQVENSNEKPKLGLDILPSITTTTTTNLTSTGIGDAADRDPDSPLDPNETSFNRRNIHSEIELEQIEERVFADWKTKCKKFPTNVGALRRKKSIKEFKIVKEMGQGAYGKVLLVAHHEDPNYEIVLKCIFKERILVDTWSRDRKLGTIPSEIQVMSFLNQFHHPNILRLLDFFEDDECYYVEIPIHGNPPAIDLFDFIEIKKSLTELEIRYIFRQIVSSIAHLHKHGLVHRDIKDENVIIDEHSAVKLIDFGSAAYVRNGPFDVFVGTMEYAPPEVLNGVPYNGMPQDVWSLGILLYTIVYKENPFYNIDDIMEGELKVPYILSPGCINLITKILQRDIEKRPTIDEIYNDPWLQI